MQVQIRKMITRPQEMRLKRHTIVLLLRRLNEKYPLMSIVQRKEQPLEVVPVAGQEEREVIRRTQKTLLREEGEEITNAETQYQA
jgi:hypothetical protein